VWVGGHSVRATEPLFGFAVFGEVAEAERVGHDGARAGDRLYLSKPIGAGSITTGVKKGKTLPADAAAAAAGMARLNRGLARALRAAGVKAATDITGFGLLGHAANLARASGVRLRLEAALLPLYSGAQELAERGIISGGSVRGRENLRGVVEIGAGVPEWLANVAFDAETSGGILACVPADRVARFLAACAPEERPVEVGEVLAGPAGVALL
jgi:selenide,water dikinase